jgi:hypothetical protein
MPLRQGIAEMVEAIEDRIEVAGHPPTWRVTAGSFESALEFVRAAYDDPVVIARQDRDRWWPRVTLTVTTEPELAAQAPPLEELARPRIPAQSLGSHDHAAGQPHDPTPVALAERQTEPLGDPTAAISTAEAEATLDEFFADEERVPPRWRSRETLAPVLLVVLSAAAVALVVLLYFTSTEIP